MVYLIIGSRSISYHTVWIMLKGKKNGWYNLDVMQLVEDMCPHF